MNYKVLLIFVLNSFSVSLSEIKGIFEDNIDVFRNLINDPVALEVESNCESYKYSVECIYAVDAALSKYKPANPENLDDLAQSYNILVSKWLFYKGDITYYGIQNDKPDILNGLKLFIISSYTTNANAQYKLFLLLETNIISFYYKRLQQDVENSPILTHILREKRYLSNFEYHDEYEKLSVSNYLLYSSALKKDQSAINAQGYRFLKGYGIKKNCESAMTYYKESSYEAVSFYYKQNRPNYYEKLNICSSEYIGFKYSGTEVVDMNQVVEYYRIEANKGMIFNINVLGQKYLFGQGIEQNFDESRYFFEKGAQLNDTTSMFYLGELYLNGWGVEQDYEKALDLYTRCEELKYTKALNSIGYMYYFGLGVPKNIRRAYDYFLSKLYYFYSI